MKDNIQLITFVALIFIFGCANQLPPGGGPFDTEPPVVVKTFPESGTLNYDKNYVEIEFNEYINKRSVTNSIFITPYFENEPEIKWYSKKMRVIFPEKLKKNSTYVISLGTDITDLRNNKMAESVILRFSTGDKIDEGIIEGKVFSEKPDGIMIYIYKLDSMYQTIRYDSAKPDFVTQTSRDGSFHIYGLPHGIFRLIAVRDKMKNFRFDINEDEIGFPVKDYKLDEKVSKIENVNFELIKIDTIKPLVNSVKFIDLNHLRVLFSEEIEIKNLSNNNFTILDDSLKKYEILGFIKTEPNSIILITESMKPDHDYKITIKEIFDLSGNKLETIKLSFYTENIADTALVTIKKIEGNLSGNVMEYFNPLCQITFSDYVAYDDFLEAFDVADMGGLRKVYKISRSDSSDFNISFGELKQKETLILKLQMSILSPKNSSHGDSIFVYKLETNSESEYGSVSGAIKNFSSSMKNENLIIHAYGMSKKKNYTAKLENEKYQIKNILPDSYLIKIAYEDSDSSKIRRGFALPFIYHKDTIKVKSRWPTTDVNFDLDDLFR